MSEPLDELYFKWLYGQVASVKEQNNHKTYWNLLRKLYITEFVWIVANDDNRAEDGRELRQAFIEATCLTTQDVEDMSPDWLRFGCSVLELFVALAKRLNFEFERSVSAWFWVLMDNFWPRWRYDADAFVLETSRLDDALDRFIWRRYKANGAGGLFPLRRPEHDQREVEIWYQMNEYLLEQGYF